ncbi:MAG: hypothetical protein GY711_08090 [bacterium]|nr:hypothetical protein [bacterium]
MTKTSRLLALLPLLFALLCAAPRATASGVHRHGLASDECELCVDRGLIRCLSCDGTKRGMVPCRPCNGLGRYDCLECEDGRIDCLTRVCKDGYSPWSGKFGSKAKQERDPCRYCKRKGTLPCKVCTKGTKVCPTCRGRGKFPGACMDCVGEGLMPCPLCAVRPNPDNCPWSVGRKRTCHAHADKIEPRPCDKCQGPKVACRSCNDTSKVPCQRCGATGKMRTVLVGGSSRGKGGVKAHVGCDGKGVFACSLCKKKDPKPCRSCDKGRITACGYCFGSKRATCHGCADERFRPFEIYGSHLFEQGMFEASVGYYDAAVKAAWVHFDERAAKLAEHTGTKEQRAQASKNMRAERDKVSKRLREALAEARAKLPD